MKRFLGNLLNHGLLCFFVILLCMPLYLALIAASYQKAAMLHPPLPVLPGTSLIYNLKAVMAESLTITGGQSILRMLLNSFIMAMLIAFGKICLALFSAFAIVYFDFPGKKYFFAMVFATMLLPVEVRIIPTFQLVADLSWLNSYAGLSLPLMASATATFLFRQFFKTIPKELIDAATIDGAGPFRFFIDILLPLSKTQIASLFVILFIYGWNQYLWPLVITTNNKMSTVVMGIHYLAGSADQVPEWNYIMAIALIALVPPCLVILCMQRWFERGLIH